MVVLSIGVILVSVYGVHKIIKAFDSLIIILKDMATAIDDLSTRVKELENKEV